MAKNLTMVREDAGAAVDEPLWLMPADLQEPIGERLIQAVSRWAGIASFVVALSAVGVWLLG